VLLRQSKGWFQVAGMGHEALAVIGTLLRDEDYLSPTIAIGRWCWPAG